MAKYTDDVKALLELIGGKENIAAVSHCMTRMRFVLVDEKKANAKEIEKLKSVKGTFTQAGQYQVIIGNDVSTFYNEFTAYAGIEGVSKEAAKQAAKTNQNPIQKIMSNLGEIFAPIIPALICGGLVLGFRNVIDAIDFFDNGTKTPCGNFPVLGRSRQLPVAYRRSGILAVAGRYRLVYYQEDGNHSDPWYRIRSDTGIFPAP